MKKKRFLLILFLGLTLIASPVFASAGDPLPQRWQTLSGELIANFKTKIVSIEKLDNRSCWAVLTPDTPDSEAVKLAEQIGEFIKNSTQDMKDLNIMIRVFTNDKQVAIAVLSGDKYAGQLMSQPDLSPSRFKGSFQPLNPSQQPNK